MLQLNLKSGVPICDQIVNGFIRMKALGLINGGDRLPSVRALALELCVNPNTVQKAYLMLESSGIIYTVKGKGCFFSDDRTAQDAVMQAAKKDFKAAVKRAAELGLLEEELCRLVKDTLKPEESKGERV